jgi:hypothetical protein
MHLKGIIFGEVGEDLWGKVIFLIAGRINGVKLVNDFCESEFSVMLAELLNG